MPKFKPGDVLLYKDPSWPIRVEVVEADLDFYIYKYLNALELDPNNDNTGNFRTTSSRMDNRFILDPAWIDQEIERLLLQPDALDTLAKNISNRYPASKKVVDS